MTEASQGTIKNRGDSTTDEELYAWTMRREAVASCLVEDIFHLRQNSSKNYDFSWLGRVPCRTVKIAGMIVGIKDYESKRIYTVDDNTGIIECHHKDLITPLSPSKRKGKTFTGFNYPPLPRPVTYVGRPVTIAGRVWRGRKVYLIVESIVPCRSYNDELTHWNTALALRESHYFINAPFVIPEATEPSQTVPEELTPVHPAKPPVLPSISSPIHDAPERREQIRSKIQLPKSPVKLRHPSRVHKRDLTVNTLKIYLKHYMDNQTYVNDDCATLDSSVAISDGPIKRRRTSTDALMPRPTFENRAIPIPPPEPIQKPRKRRKIDPEAGIHGLTMSYLCQVPELQLLAERIVATEDRKKRQEARQAREEAKARGLSIPPKTGNTKLQTSKRERTKRLFRQAIIKLCDEGSIVLWDGPRRVWSSERDSNGSRLWHTNTTVDTTVSSLGFSNPGDNPYLEDSQDHEMSEPDPNEESYVSLTPAHLGKYVEKAIEEICSRKEKVRGFGNRSSKGPKLTEILSRLKADGRWRSVGECLVAEALQWLKDEERVWEVGGGHWELTI